MEGLAPVHFCLLQSQLDELTDVKQELKSGMADAKMTNEDSSHLLWNVSSANFQVSRTSCDNERCFLQLQAQCT